MSFLPSPKTNQQNTMKRKLYQPIIHLLSGLHQPKLSEDVPVQPVRNWRRTLTGAALASLALMTLPAQAGLLAYEGFNYPAGSGNLTGLSGGFGWNGSWQTVNNGSSSVQSVGLTASGNAPSGYDAHSVGNSAFTPNGTRTGRWLDESPGGSFGSQGYLTGSGSIGADGKTLYLSFLQQVNGSSSYYEFELHRGNLSDPGRMAGVGNDTGDNDVHFRIESPAGGSSSFTDLGAGNTSVNFYVVRIDFNYSGGSSTVTLYRNPTTATEPATSTAQINGITADMSFDGISFGAFNSGRTVAHDEVRLGTSYADVTSPGVYSTGNWTGDGADNHWSTAGNWNNGVVPVWASPLTFAGSAHLNNTNDLTGVSATSITFDAAAGAFTLAGNGLGLDGNISFTANPTTPITQTINLPLSAADSVTIDTPTNGSLTLAGNFTSSSDTSLVKLDAGTLTLGGSNVVTSFDFNGGTTTITGTTTVNGDGGSRIYVGDGDYLSGCNGTLVIQPGATLAFTGNFADAFVVGRDSGSGTVIQNGGIFTFNPGNQSLFLIGATGDNRTRAEYNMNGGLLDMNGDTLGVGWGNESGTTGMLNQVSGVITNLGNLRIPFTGGASGMGGYTLSGVSSISAWAA
jgi:hypothetical protein